MPLMGAATFTRNGLSDVLLDLDGTLTDPKDGITGCIQYALQKLRMRVPPADELIWCIGPPLREAFATLLETRDPGLLDQALALYRERFARTGLYENRVYPDTRPALARMQKAGLRLFWQRPNLGFLRSGFWNILI